MQSVRAVGEAIAAAARPPRAWLQASTAPGRLLEDGFFFRYPDWQGAARELCARYKSPNA